MQEPREKGKGKQKQKGKRKKEEAGGKPRRKKDEDKVIFQCTKERLLTLSISTSAGDPKVGHLTADVGIEQRKKQRKKTLLSAHCPEVAFHPFRWEN